MKFLQKLLTIFVILVFSRFNFSVPYFISNTLILNIKLSSCNESKNDSNDLQRNTNSHILSQESSTNTNDGENNFVKLDHKDSTTNNAVKTVPKSGINLDPNLDLGFPKNTDHYSSLCFSDDLELGEPLQLIYPNHDHTQLLLNDEAIKHLENIPKPVYTVGIIGSVNTGKSTLLNLLNDNHLCNTRLKRKKSVYEHKDDDKFDRGVRKSKSDTDNKDSKGFKVATTPEPETVGIWMYSKPLRMSRRILEKKLQNSPQSLDTSYNSLKNLNDGVDNQFSKVVRVSSSGADKSDEDDLDEDVNVVFLDIEGFSSHRNVFKYDEAIFSVASSICSEIIYLSNKTLNSADLQLVEELIKSSLLSKISNLYTLYTNLGDFSEDRDEIFQYFLRMFENKNITFLINEFNFTSDQAFAHLVNLLNGPKRDLSLHELFMYHSKKKKAEQKDYDYGRASKLNKQDELLKENRYQHRKEADTSPSEPQIGGNKGDGVIDLINQDSELAKPAKGGSSGLEMANVMFNSQGYIFHMLFNSVNMATLPTTSKNSLLSIIMDPGKDNKQTKRTDKDLDDEYVRQLSRFKLELFQRSTRNALSKFCVVDGVSSVCNMSGRDVAEMAKFTLTSLSLNKFYKLATNVGSIEGMAKLDYKDAFDEYFRVFRSTRLLMIKNDLYETYKNILNSYINSSVSKSKEHKSGNENSEVVPMNKMPTIAMLKKQSLALKGQLLDLMVKNYENEATSDDFSKIKTDLTQGFDRVAQLVELELFNKLKNYCTEASEKLLEAYQRNIDNLELPMLPSKLKFLHDLPKNFRKQYSVVVDGLAPEDSDHGFECDGTSSRAVVSNHDLLSQSEPCDQVFEHYLGLLDQKISELIKKNEDLIDKHFNQILMRALNHFRIKFIEAERNYEIPLEEALKLTSGVIKESHNIMLTHLGEFHAMEYLVNEYKSRLRQSLSEETEHFKRIYTSRCLQKFDDMQAHYLDNYERLLHKYTQMPANPEMLVKFHEFVRYLARSEFYKSPCIGYVEIEKKHSRFETKLKTKFRQIMGENVRLVSEALEPHFDRIDEYLLGKMDSCSVFTYFRYNAKRYARFKITHKLIFTTLNLPNDSPNPDDVLAVERVLFNAANALPTLRSDLPRAGFSHTSIASSYDIDLKELNRKFITLNLVRIHKAFVGRVVDRYMAQRMPRFKKLFRQRYCNLAVLVCSVILLGMSTLSFMLAENGYSKLAFSMLGFASYALLVGVDTTKRTLRRLQEILKNVSKRLLGHLLRLMLVLLNKLALLMGVAATFVFMRIGFLYTFMFGFFSALFLYIYYKVRRFFRRHRSSTSKK